MDEASTPFTVDLDQNSASLNISRDIYARILKKAVDQTQQDLHDFEDAFSGDDFTKLQSISHRLKGDYGNLRISELSSIAKQMNELSRGGKDKETLAVLFNKFKEYFTQLRRFVEESK